jgi:SPP1 family predicted phage head-tail adaptor
MALLPSGLLSEVFEIQEPVSTRNAAGENVTNWTPVRQVYGSYEAISYSEQARRGQIGGNLQATVRIRYVDGVTGMMRLRWVSRGDRILMIAGLVERGRREELELTVEEQAT